MIRGFNVDRFVSNQITQHPDKGFKDFNKLPPIAISVLLISQSAKGVKQEGSSFIFLAL